MRLQLVGYAAVLGKTRCSVLFGNRPGGTIILDPNKVEYNATAPQQNIAGFVPVALDCAASSGQNGGSIRRNLDLLLEYANPAKAEIHAGDAVCTLFLPCTVLVQLSSPPPGAAEAGGLYVAVPDAFFLAGGQRTRDIVPSQSVEVTTPSPT